MGDRTRIEWAEATWNPVVGCTKVSPGCAYCYAERIMSRRGWPRFRPDTARVQLMPHRLMEPLRWARPRLVFTCSMADLFHELVPDDYILQVFRVMQEADHHIFQVLTKRVERLATFSRRLGGLPRNVWVGVSAENQTWAERRLPLLMEVPAQTRFVSCEPLLGPMDLGRWLSSGSLHWVIVGGESGGPPARRLVEPCRGHAGSPSCAACQGTGWAPKQQALQWVRSLRDQCLAAGVPFFFKQWGGPRPDSAGRLLDGRTYDAFPPLGHPTRKIPEALRLA
jgi:protein gp37